MDKQNFDCLNILLVENTTKGTVLEETVGKEDPVELDYFKTFESTFECLEYMGALAKMKYHSFFRLFHYLYETTFLW